MYLFGYSFGVYVVLCFVVEYFVKVLSLFLYELVFFVVVCEFDLEVYVVWFFEMVELDGLMVV